MKNLSYSKIRRRLIAAVILLSIGLFALAWMILKTLLSNGTGSILATWVIATPLSFLLTLIGTIILLIQIHNLSFLERQKLQ